MNSIHLPPQIVATLGPVENVDHSEMCTFNNIIDLKDHLGFIYIWKHVPRVV